MTPIQLFASGHESGYNHFFKELYKQLLFYAMGFLHDKPNAEDIVSESFVKAWMNRKAYTHEMQLKSWLYTTVRNACLNKMKKDVWNERKISALKSVIIEPPHLESIIHTETIASVHAMIETLPDKCRRIFKLLYIEGYTVRELVERFGYNVSTVKNQKGRGLGLLKKRLATSQYHPT